MRHFAIVIVLYGVGLLQNKLRHHRHLYFGQRFPQLKYQTNRTIGSVVEVTFKKVIICLSY